MIPAGANENRPRIACVIEANQSEFEAGRMPQVPIMNKTIVVSFTGQHLMSRIFSKNSDIKPFAEFNWRPIISRVQFGWSGPRRRTQEKFGSDSEVFFSSGGSQLI